MTYQPPPPPPYGENPAQQPQYQQPQYPPQQPQAQQQPTPPYWPNSQTPPAHQGGNPQFSSGPPQAAGEPVYYAPDPTATAAALDRLESDAQARRTATFSREIKIPGPNGETRWDSSVPVNYEGYVDLYLCGAWGPGIPTPFAEKVTHFMKTRTRPNGAVVVCSGNDCEFCNSRKLALADPQLEKSAQDWGKQLRRTLYNAFDLSNPQSHYGQDGVMRPFILPVGVNLQKDLRRMFEMKGGIGAFTDPRQGRPIRITKKKTGPNPMDIEWGAEAHDPGSLPEYFWPGLANLWDLNKEIAPSSPDDVMKAIQELGWPVPETLQQKLQGGQSPNAPYVPHAQPPHPSPYDQQQLPLQQGPSWPPAAGGMPPPPSPGMAPAAPPGPSAPPSWAPPPSPPGMIPPVQQPHIPGSSPGSGMSLPPPPPPGGVPQGGTPPHPSMPAGVPPPPPPVTSTGQGIPPAGPPGMPPAPPPPATSGGEANQPPLPFPQGTPPGDGNSPPF